MGGHFGSQSQGVGQTGAATSLANIIRDYDQQGKEKLS